MIENRKILHCGKANEISPQMSALSFKECKREMREIALELNPKFLQITNFEGPLDSVNNSNANSTASIPQVFRPQNP